MFQNNFAEELERDDQCIGLAFIETEAARQLAAIATMSS
jgi:hypothetical protein